MDTNPTDILDQLLNIKTIDSIKPLWNVQLQLALNTSPLLDNSTHTAGNSAPLADEIGHSTPQAVNSALEIANSTLQAGNSVLWADNSALWTDNATPFFEETNSKEGSSDQIKETVNSNLQAADTDAMVLFTPTVQQFRDSFQSLLNQYEKVVSDFAPISVDGRVKSFLQHSKYDLLMLLEEEQNKPKRHQVLDTWPNVETLLHQYGPYKQCVVYTEKIISLTMNGVQKSTAVRSVIIAITGCLYLLLLLLLLLCPHAAFPVLWWDDKEMQRCEYWSLCEID